MGQKKRTVGAKIKNKIVRRHPGQHMDASRVGQMDVQLSRPRDFFCMDALKYQSKFKFKVFGSGLEKTGADCQHAGSFTHSAKLLSCPWGRDPWGTRNIVL
jgi:hypothetical protein